MFDPRTIARPNVLAMQPYSSARDEFKGKASVWLDANENPFESDLNRYPDPQQRALKGEIAKLKGVSPANIFLGNGSDEAIDLILRVFCKPGKDKILIMPPTYGMYTVSAETNDVEVVEVPLNPFFQIDRPRVEETIESQSPKAVFICSPNNPTGNRMASPDIFALAEGFAGLVIVDEAYVDFADKSLLRESVFAQYPNLVILQTFSKAWGMAGARLGMAFAHRVVIELLNKIKPPYNINQLTQTVALERLKHVQVVEDQIRLLLRERDALNTQLQNLDGVLKVFPSDANFLLIQVEQPDQVYQALVNRGIVVRNRSRQVPGTLRVSVGKPEENRALLEALNKILVNPTPQTQNPKP